MIATTSLAVNASGCQPSNAGNNASGIWSIPVALLLGFKPNRRLIKLEHKSPTIAEAPIKNPKLTASPNNGASVVVAKIADNTPRIVFEDPNTG